MKTNNNLILQSITLVIRIFYQIKTELIYTNFAK